MAKVQTQQREYRFLPVRALIFFVAVLLALKLGFALFTKVAADEPIIGFGGSILIGLTLTIRR